MTSRPEPTSLLSTGMVIAESFLILRLSSVTNGGLETRTRTVAVAV